MTPEAKRLLSSTIRAIRARLLSDLHTATESAYRLSVRAHDAELSEAAEVKRKRLETWIAEQVRGETDSKRRRTADDFRREVEKQAAYTLLNRLVILRLMEAAGLHKPAVATGGWESQGYKTLREIAPALIQGDEGEGYPFLLQLVFEDLATDLPGLYRAVGVADLVPIPTATLRYVVESLDVKELASCWDDDMTLGWVYQYWNDPEREALDAKLNAGGKVEPHEIASKTQMFTERYMVDWLLQNSLGPMWLAMCKKHGWQAEVEADGTLDSLEERRAQWRDKRERGEVKLTDLMPLYTDAERRWAYYVPQPIPEDAIEHASDSIRDLKILDPAVGSGHFLVVAFDLLVALYREEARHRGLSSPPADTPAKGAGGEEAHDWTDRDIVERILEHNLHGIDLDPRAVQIAAAALWLKGQSVCRESRPSQMNLVASNLRLASLPDDDPALVELRREVEHETGIPPELTDTIIHALKGADHLGSLLKVDAAVEEAIRQHETASEQAIPRRQQLLADEFAPAQREFRFDRAEARLSIVERLEAFLAKHTSGDDRGLRLRGEQLAAGVRFVRIVGEGIYDLVVGNPPYQGTSKMADAAYVRTHYLRGKADLYAAFLERGLQLARNYGLSALLTMRTWMFLKQFSSLREWLLQTFDLRTIADLSTGAFEEISAAQVIVSVCISVFRRHKHTRVTSVASRLFDAAIVLQPGETQRKRSAALCQVGRFEFVPARLSVLPESPLVYWWSRSLFNLFEKGETIGETSPAKFGANTGNNVRFLRRPWEVSRTSRWSEFLDPTQARQFAFIADWVPAITGAKGRVWLEPLNDVIEWTFSGLQLRILSQVSVGAAIRNPVVYFERGIAFSMIGASFAARAHRFLGVIEAKGSSFYPSDVAKMLCVMNSRKTRDIIQSLNPTISFQVGDVNRLPIFSIDCTNAVFERLEEAFTEHESHREPSVEFRRPGPSPWRHSQDWAQTAVDRSEDEPLPPYEPQYDAEPPTDHLSFALGIALGRFGQGGEGILDPATSELAYALPAGMLFLDGTLDSSDRRDGLGHPAARRLLDCWTEYGAAIAPGGELRDYLRTKLFEDVHRKMYENRPIHWPLSSAKRTFVSWVTIHRWTDSTLRVLLADHLNPTLIRLEGELNDLRAARDGADKKTAREAEKLFPKVQKSREELADFIKAVEQCAEKGAPPVDAKCPPRQVDARYAPDLDDGVMINSAALWPLLTPQWKDPKKWWRELATAQGKKDYDWAHLAMRYWPTRVDAKCQQDPSLGVAHGCFWRYHPARAWVWELRLQDEIGSDFRIRETPYRGDGGDVEHRAAYLAEHPDQALEAIGKEVQRRRRKKQAPQPELRILEPGLWTRVPDQCWDLELRVIEKQGEDFRLLAPDETDARAAYERACPARVSQRARLLVRLRDERPLLPDEEFDDNEEDDVEEEE